MPDRAAGRFLAMSSGLFLLGTREAWPELMPAASVVDVARPTPAEQRAAWLRRARPRGRADGRPADRPVRLRRRHHRDMARPAAGSGDGTAPDGQLPRLWDACAAICRPRMDALAQRIESRVTWDDLVLPEPELSLLHQIADQVRHRAIVYYGWGFAERLNRSLGITALFAGPSGTGKTMAAEVLANDLRLSLYRIDLSAVVSKYIGETEKNLRRMFEAAEQGAAVLFFDEADALFGKRSEVKDSHDRYANIEINYLLQRMESYRGVAVLATNMRSALDQAFLRRLRFVLTFPFPAAAERRAIWSKVFPPRTQTADLDLDRLAGLTATGGMISNIALNAAFLAARAARAGQHAAGTGGGPRRVPQARTAGRGRRLRLASGGGHAGMNVELHIERLVLNGLPLPPGGRAALAGAFGRELTRLIQDGGLRPALLGGTSVPRLTAALDPSGLAAHAGGRPGRRCLAARRSVGS